jgi:hypothetical protein
MLHPLKPKLSTKSAFIIFIIIWLIALGSSIPSLFFYNVYFMDAQYVIPFIIISCAYFRIASHLYFSKPVGQTKHQEVIARNKRKVSIRKSNLVKTEKQVCKQKTKIQIIVVFIERKISIGFKKNILILFFRY